MADCNSACTPAAKEATNRARSRSEVDLLDTLTATAAQLDAALKMIHGEGFASFDTLNAMAKQDYLWLCADLAAQLHLHVSTLAAQRYAPPGQ